MDKDQLNVGIRQGIKLTNLSLKQEVLEDMDLPFNVVAGHIGELQLEIPWSSLFPTPSKPVKATVDGVYLVLAPKLGTKYDAAKDKEDKHKAKQRALEAWEEEKKAAEVDEAEKKKSASFTQKLVASIVNNIQVFLSNIHIRYEDSTSYEGHPFAMSITLSKVAIQSTNEHWEPAFLSGMPTFVHKLMELDSLALAWETDATLLGGLPKDELIAQMKSRILRATDDIDTKQALLSPLSFELRLILNNEGEAAGKPKADVSINMPKFELQLDEDQLQDALMFTDALSRFNRQLARRHLRPTVKIGEPGWAKVWFQYAISCHVEDVHNKRVQWSWANMQQRRDVRVQYIESYETFLQTKKPKKELRDQLHALEDQAGLEDIKRYRTVAESHIPKPEKGGWFSGWFGSSKSKKEDEFKLTDTDMKAIETAIGFDKMTAAEQLEIKSKAYVALKADFQLSLSAVRLRQGVRKTGVAFSDAASDLLLVQTLGLAVQFEQRPAAEAIKAQVSISSMVVADVQAGNHPFAQIMKPQYIHKPSGRDDKFFSLLFETNPLDGAADSVVKLNAKPMDITYRPAIIERMGGFFEKPGEVDLGDVADAASAQVSNITEQSKTGLAFAVENHKTLALDVRIAAPTVIVPAESSKLVLALDLGDLSVKSDLTGLDRTNLAVADLSKIEEQMYDKLVINIADVQAILTTLPEELGDDSWRKAFDVEGSFGIHHVLEKTSLGVSVFQCIAPEPGAMPKMRIEGELPRINVRFSNRKYAQLMAVVKEVAPKPSPDSKKAAKANPRDDADADSLLSEYGAPAAAAIEPATPGAAPGAPPASTPAVVSPVAIVIDDGEEGEDGGGAAETAQAALSGDSDEEFFSADEEEEDGGSAAATAASTAPGAGKKAGKLTHAEKLRLAAVLEMVASFKIGHIGVTLSELPADAEEETDLVGVAICDFHLHRFAKRTYDMAVELSLGAIEIADYIATGDDARYVMESSPTKALLGQTIEAVDTSGNLISVTVHIVDPKSPEFATTHQSTKMAVEAAFGSLRLYAQLTTLKKLMAFADATFAAPPDDPAPAAPLDGPGAGALAVPGAGAGAGAAADAGSGVAGMLKVPGAKKPRSLRQKKDKAHREAARGWVDMKVVFQAGSLEALVREPDQNITSFAIAGLKAEVTQTAIAMDVTAKLNDLCVVDLTTAGSERAIVSVVGDEVFSLKAHVSSDDTSFRPQLTPDITAEVNINGISIVYLAKYVSFLTNFAAKVQPPPKPEPPKRKRKPRRRSRLNSASQSVASMSQSVASGFSSASGSAKRNKGAASTLGTKICFDVQIKAPVIHVPLSSTADRELVLDFGRIDVSNSLAAAPDAATAGGLAAKAVLDTIRLSLDELSVFFVSTGDVNKRTLVQPVTLTVEATRSLLPAYHGVPGIAASGEIPSFNVAVSNADYADIMAITTGNLAEAIPPPPKPEPAQATPQTPVTPASQAHDPTPPNGSVSAPPTPGALQASPQASVPTGRPRSVSRAVQEAMRRADEQAVAEIFTATQAKFTLKLFKISLLQEDKPLADLTLSSLDVGLEISSDDAMDAHVSMEGLDIHDARDYEPKPFPFLLHRVRDQADAPKALLDVKFNKHDGDQAAVIKLCKPRITLAPNFLLALQAFLPQDDDKAADKAKPDGDEEEEQDDTTEDTAPPDTADLLDEVPEEEEEEEGDKTALKVYLILDNPQITVVADHLDVNSKAMHLSFDANISYVTNATQQNINLAMQGLTVGSYRPQLHQEQYSKVLQPATIMFNFSRDLETKKQIVTLIVESLDIKFGFCDLETINAVMAALSPPADEEGGEADGGSTAAAAPATFSATSFKMRKNKARPWYLRAEQDRSQSMRMSVLEEDEGPVDITDSKATIALDSFDVTLVDDCNDKDHPLVMLSAMVDASAHGFGHIRNKNTKTRISAEIGIAALYYNEHVSAWEPLLEPILDQDSSSLSPWMVQVEVAKVPNPDEHSLEPDLQIQVSATDSLEFTVTNNFLRSITGCAFVAGPPETALAGALSDAPRLVTENAQEVVATGAAGLTTMSSAAFTGFQVCNHTGHRLSFTAVPQFADGTPTPVSPNEAKAIQFETTNISTSARRQTPHMKALHANDNRSKKRIGLRVAEWSSIDNVAVDTVGTFHYAASSPNLKFPLAVIVEVKLVNSVKVAVVRSSFKITNEMLIPMDLGFKPPKKTDVAHLVTIQPNETYHVPVAIAYRSGLSVRPAGLAYEWSTTEVSWRGEAHQTPTCAPSQRAFEETGPLNLFAALFKEEFDNGQPDARLPHHHLVLSPLLVVQNLLPFDIQAQVYMGTADPLVLDLAPAQRLPLYADADHKVRVQVKCAHWAGEDDCAWGQEVTIWERKKKPAKTMLLTAPDHRQLKLGVFTQKIGKGGCTEVSLYSPYWMINKTGRTMSYRQAGDKDNVTECHHPPADGNEPVLFSFVKSGDVARARIEDSRWGQKMNLDTVGNTGTFHCTHSVPGCADFEACVTTRFAEGSLTKIITFTPRHIVFNHTKCPIVISEPDGESVKAVVAAGGLAPEPVVVPPQQYTPYFPLNAKGLVQARFEGCGDDTPQFSISDTASFGQKQTVDGKPVLFNVAIRSEKAAFLVHFNMDNGLTDLRLENRTEFPITYTQAEEAEALVVPPGRNVMYMRKDPLGAEAIDWAVEGCTDKQLQQEFRTFVPTILEFKKPDGSAGKIFGVCFPDAAQPTMLFVDNERDAKSCLKQTGLEATMADNAFLFEHATLHFSLALAGFGLSLVDGGPQEVAYISLLPKTHWEQALEGPDGFGDDWQRFAAGVVPKLDKLAAGDTDGRVSVDKGHVVKESAHMVFHSKDGEESAIRRKASPGLLLEFIDSDRLQTIKLTIEHLQIDNQLADAYVQTILAPAHPEKRNRELPFLKFLFVKSKASEYQESSILMVQRLSLLIQKMDLSVTETFLLKMVDFADFGGEKDLVVHLERDLEALKAPLYPPEIMKGSSAAVTKQSWKVLQLHPLSINVSFMLTAFEEEEDADDNIVRYVLKALGVAVANIEGVPMKFNSLKLTNVFCTKDELVGDITNFFVSQGLREAYKVLGCLDFLGNPVRSFGHLATGFDDLFYEPNVDGVLSLATGTLAGATGIASSIAGSVGNAMAVLSMDDDYKRKRQQDAARRRNAGDHLKYGGERLARGFAEGIGGLFLSPLEGAKKEGALGFFKGVGKGLLGVVAKPVGGVIDMTTSALDVVDLARQHAQGDHSVRRARNPRYIRPDKVVGVYSKYEAGGAALLRSVQDGKYAKAGYIIHYSVPETAGSAKRNIVFFCQKTVMFMPAKGDKIGWTIPFDEIERSKAGSKGVDIAYTRQEEGRKPKKASVTIPCSDKGTCQFLLKTLVDIQKLSV